MTLNKSDVDIKTVSNLKGTFFSCQTGQTYKATNNRAANTNNVVKTSH